VKASLSAPINLDLSFPAKAGNPVNADGIDVYWIIRFIMRFARMMTAMWA
jgi:hypothetical protein